MKKPLLFLLSIALPIFIMPSYSPHSYSTTSQQPTRITITLQDYEEKHSKTRLEKAKEHKLRAAGGAVAAVYGIGLVLGTIDSAMEENPQNRRAHPAVSAAGSALFFALSYYLLKPILCDDYININPLQDDSQKPITK